MTKGQLRRLFKYDLWANERVLRALEALPPGQASSSIARLFSHIIAAQQVWLRRVQGADLFGLKAWPEMDPESWPGLLQTTHAAWLDQLKAHADGFEAVVSYQDTKGHPFETPLHEIITHVVIHGQHHRAQIATHLRALGLTPPPTDFIFFTRETAPA